MPKSAGMVHLSQRSYKNIRTKKPDTHSGIWFFDTPGGTRKGGGSASCRKNSPAYQAFIIRTLSQQEKGSDYFCSLENNMDMKAISCKFNIEQPVAR